MVPLLLLGSLGFHPGSAVTRWRPSQLGGIREGWVGSQDLHPAVTSPSPRSFKRSHTTISTRVSLSPWPGGDPWGSEWVSAQSCLPLWDPMDRSPPGFSVHGILQARRLEWAAISRSRILLLAQKLNPRLLHCRQLLPQSHSLGSPPWMSSWEPNRLPTPLSSDEVFPHTGGASRGWVRHSL